MELWKCLANSIWELGAPGGAGVSTQCLWCCSAGKLFLCGACAGIQSSQPEPGSVGSPFPSFQALVSNSAVGSVSYCTGNRCSTRIQLSLLCLFMFLIEGWKTKAHVMSEVTGLPGFIWFNPRSSLFLKQEGKEEFESMTFPLTNQLKCVESLRRLCKILNDSWIELHFSL